MSGLPWFRMYASVMTDPDVEELSFEDQRHFVWVLCMKANGLLDKDFDDHDKRERAIARRLGLQGEAFTFTRQRLMASKLIDSQWQPRSWDRLQFRSDHDAAERQRRSRANRVTAESRDSHTPDTEQIQNRTDTEQKAREREPLPSGLDLQAWERWETYKREIRKPIKPASLLAAQRKLAGFGSDQAAVVEQSIAQGWTGLFALKESANGTGRQVHQPRPSAVERVRLATERFLREGEDPGGGGVVVDG
jgi:hypothetical protein